MPVASVDLVGDRSAPWYPDAVALALLALLVRLPAYFAGAALGFDDGTYGAAALVMRDGARPFRQLFSSQGPLQLPLIYVGDLVGGRTLDSPRLASVIAGVVATIAAWHIARSIGTRRDAAVVGVLVSTTGTMLFTTGPITGDGLAVALSAVALAITVDWLRRPSAPRAVAIGLALGAALSTKLLAALVAIPIALLLADRRRWRDLTITAATSGGALLATMAAFGFSRVVDQTITYQLDSPRTETVRDQLHKLLQTASQRDATLIAAIALGAIAAMVRRPVRSQTGGMVLRLAWAWLAVCALLLVFEKNMWSNHVSVLILPATVVLTLRPPPLSWLLVVLIATVPYQLNHFDHVVYDNAARGVTARAIADVRALPAGSWVASDDPGIPWRAGHREPTNLVDTSIKRILTGRLTTADVGAAVSDRRVCAVLVWDYRFGAALPGFDRRLRELGYRPSKRYGTWHRDLSQGRLAALARTGDRVLWTRPSCRA